MKSSVGMSKTLKNTEKKVKKLVLVVEDFSSKKLLVKIPLENEK